MSALIYHESSSWRIIKLFFFCLKDLICISDTTNKDKPIWSIVFLFLSQKYINSKTNSLYQCVSSFSFLILFCHKSLEKLELFGEIGNMERQLWASAFLSKIFYSQRIGIGSRWIITIILDYYLIGFALKKNYFLKRKLI